MDIGKCRYGPCHCQRYKAKNNAKEECLYCNHSIGFHEVPFTDINTEEHPFGQCQTCYYCQRYKEGTQAEICTYCGHYQGFHLDWPTISVTTSSSAAQPAQPTPANGRRAGRPEADSITIKYIICFDKVRSNKIPKEGKCSWSKLEEKNLIKKNITISNKDDILSKFRDLFGLNQGLKLYSGKTGKPIEVVGVLNYGLIKSTVTKANQRLYIGPDTDDIVNTVNTNLPYQSSHGRINELFYGTRFESQGLL